MKTVAELVDFRRDLFFEGAVQIGWFDSDPVKREQAASHFIFHGPDYHGVSASELSEISSSPLIDTASLVQTMAAGSDQGSKLASLPIALVIAGYGTGKSHLGLTLASLFADPRSNVSKNILANIEQAAPAIGSNVKQILQTQNRPSLVLAINGMGDFDLAAELSRQALMRLRDAGLDTSPIEDLWPRFQVAEKFVLRNMELREKEFIARFGEDCNRDFIMEKLREHDEMTFVRVAEIFEQANGYPIRSIGQESPQQLIQTLCETYCGEDGEFKNLMIVFDEFGRYLEFAVERPYIAGDAALQQLFEAVQNNSDHCLMMCLVQYELKAYVSRVSHEKRNTINRYIGRYDAAQKFFLSTNLETLFAHLIEKKNAPAISALVAEHADEFSYYHQTLKRWFPTGEFSNVWEDPTLFNKVIVEGCWPLNPLATWFLCRLKDQFQHRSAVTFIADAIERAGENASKENGKAWTIPPVDLCSDALLEELISTEETQGGAIAHSFKSAVKRYENDLKPHEKRTLKGVLVAYKIGLKLSVEEEAIQALSLLAGMERAATQKAVNELKSEYGVLEWNQRFERYEILGDAVPRSAFVSYLKMKVDGLTTEDIEEIFSANGKKWTAQKDVIPSFAASHDIRSVEWRYEVSFCHFDELNRITENKIKEAQSAIRVDDFRGQLIMIYFPSESEIDAVREDIQKLLDEKLQSINGGIHLPVAFLLIHDIDGRLKRLLGEFWVLDSSKEDEDFKKFQNFIDDSKIQIQEELKLAYESLVINRNYVFPTGLNPKNGRLQKVGHDLFELTYPKVVSFPFDGFGTAKGLAAKDSREIAVELFKGTVDQDWISSAPPKRQSRVLSLFRKWGATSTSNEVEWYPKNTIVGEIITNLENELKDEGQLNFGEAFDRLLVPPYGCNNASACLLLALFIAPRKNICSLVYEGHDIKAAVWISKAFKGNFIKPEVLNTTQVRYISETEASEWEQLLARWDAEQTYSGQMAFLNTAEELKERVPLPYGVLSERYQRLVDHSQIALAELAKHEQFLVAQENFFERAIKNQNVSNLSRVGQSIVNHLRQMENHKEQWTLEYKEPLEKFLNQVRQAVVQFFDDWLPSQTCLNVKNISRFEHKMGLVEKNFEVLQLEDKKTLLHEHITSIAQRIEQLEKLRHIKDEVQAFLGTRLIKDNTPISQIKLWKDDTKDISQTLSKYNQFADANELAEIKAKIQDFKLLCDSQIKATKEKMGLLWNRDFENIADIQNLSAQIYKLQPLFSGESVDSSDLLQMLDQISAFQRDFSIWQNISLSEVQLNELFEQRLKEAEEIMDSDEPPPWDPEPVYQMIYHHVLAERKTASDEWFSRIYIEPARVPDMVPDDCHKLLNQLQTIPEYVENDKRIMITQLQETLEKRLNSLELEGLLARFRSLSERLRQKFLELAAKEI